MRTVELRHPWGLATLPEVKRIIMRKVAFLVATLVLVPSMACGYGTMVVHPNGKLYVQRHDYFLFGALRKIYECTPDGIGNVSCVAMAGRP